MPEINYQQAERYISKLSEKDFAPVYLIHGEEFLCAGTLEKLSKKLLMGEDSAVGYEMLEGDAANTVEAIDRVNTFTLLAARKIVVLANSRIFYEKKNSANLIENAKKAVADNHLKKGARIFLDFLSINDMKLEDVSDKKAFKTLNIVQDDSEDTDWINHILTYCAEHNLTVASGKSSADRMLAAIEKGFPEKNRLIITTDYVDKRRLLYKCIKENGVVVDCTVPMGERKTDRDAQSAILNAQLNSILAKSGKTMRPDAFSALYEKTGFDIRTFFGNVEKLVDYVGERKSITPEDVHSLLSRTKSDPIFEITNAVSDRNADKALYYAHFLIEGGMHPLQILSALTNQIRKLIISRSFVDQFRNRGWHDKISFPEFKRSVMPLVVENDRVFLELMAEWGAILNPSQADGSPKKKKKTKTAKPATDVVMAKNPNNAYPVYQLMLKSAYFSMPELTSAMNVLYKADGQLKKTSQNPKLVLEKTIINICRKTNNRQ